MKSPGFTLLTVLILAIGIAGTAVMVALVQGVLVRPLPVRDEDRLIVAWTELRSSGYAHYPFGDTGIEEAARSSRLLESVAGVSTNGVSRTAIDDEGTTEYVNDALVTGGFFEVLGVKPILGRTLTRAHDADGAERVVVISYALWQRRYHGSRDVIGRRIWGKDGFAIVGVMPPDLDYPKGVDIWRTPRSLKGEFKDAALREVDLVARLRPGVTKEQAASELAVLIRQLESLAPPDSPRGLLPVVRPFKDEVIGNVRLTMLALSAAVLLMLLIASANAANLLLMRNEARRSELAVRMALGAGRGRIVAQVLTESLVLAVAAGAAGLALTWWSLQPLVRLVPDGLPRVESVRVDWTVCLMAIGIALATAAISGLAPALSISSDLVSYLRSAGRGVTGSASRALRRAFVVVQVALAVTIIAAAGLLTRTVLNLQSIDTGLAADRLVLVELSVPWAENAAQVVRHRQFLDTVVQQLEALPFVEAATPINMPPFSGTVGWAVPRITAEGQTAEQAAANPSMNFESIYPNYFRTFGARIAAGRPFTDADREGAQKVAIISEDVARGTWPGQNPIGKRMKLGGPSSTDDWLTVVGVTAPARYRALTRATPMLYLPAAQFLVTAQILAVRTAAPLDQVTAVARTHVRAANPRGNVMRVSSFASLMDAPLAAPRFNAFLLNLFGIVAVLLSAIGLYAVMSTYVRQRDRDIAVRRALGATTGDVQRLVFGEAVSLAGLGAAVGLGGAFGAARLVEGMLYGVDSLDPVTMLGAAGLMIAASVLASYLPVRRATRIDPLVALRYE